MSSSSILYILISMLPLVVSYLGGRGGDSHSNIMYDANHVSLC